MSFESQEIDSNLGDTANASKIRTAGKKPKFVKNQNSDMFDDARPDGDYVSPDDIQLGEDAIGGNHGPSNNNMANKASLYESSNDGGSSSSAMH